LKNGIHPLIFTNGIIPPRSLKYLTKLPPDRYSILINLNDPSKLTAIKRRSLFKTLKTFKGQNNITLGINFFSEEQDYNYIINIACKYEFSEIRWSVANPTVESTDHYYKRKYRNMVSRAIVFLKEANAAGLFTHADDVKILPCLISSTNIAAINLLDSSSKMIAGSCTSSGIDLDTSLRIMYCFALPYYGDVRLDKFSSLKDIKKYLCYLYNQLHTIPLFPECDGCQYFKSSACTGGCLAAKCNYLKIMPESIIVDTINMPIDLLMKTEFRLRGDLIQLTNVNKKTCYISNRKTKQMSLQPPYYAEIIKSCRRKCSFISTYKLSKTYSKSKLQKFIVQMHYLGLIDIRIS